MSFILSRSQLLLTRTISLVKVQQCNTPPHCNTIDELCIRLIVTEVYDMTVCCYRSL